MAAVWDFEPGVLAMSDGSGRFASSPAPAGTSGAVASQFADYDNDGLLDLLAMSPPASASVQECRQRVDGRTGERCRACRGASAVDGRRRRRPGRGRRRRGDHQPRASRVAEQRRPPESFAASPAGGSGTNRRGVGSKVDMQAGSLRPRLETSAARPAVAPGDIRFGLGPRAGADAARVLWPSGTSRRNWTSDLPPVPQVRRPAASP